MFLNAGLISSVSPQPGPSRELNEPIESVSINGSHSSPSKRRQRGLQHPAQFPTNNSMTIEDDVPMSISNQSSKPANEEDDDDITLQDLVAMETMDDADELDINSENSFQSQGELDEHGNVTGISRIQSNPMNSLKTLTRVHTEDNFTARHFGGTIAPQFIRSPTGGPLESYRNAMLHMKGRSSYVFFFKGLYFSIKYKTLHQIKIKKTFQKL